jgi:ribonuclease P protein component
LQFKVKQAFPACRRIRNRTEFEQAFRANCRTNKWFAVYVRKNESKLSRLGIIASKRIMPKAVSRNFAKRLIRDVFRRNFSVECEFDVVVRVRRQLNPETSVEGRIALNDLLQTIQMK